MRLRNDVSVGYNTNTNRNFRLYCKNAGIVTSDKLSVHCLRKAYGTNLAHLGPPVHILKDLKSISFWSYVISLYMQQWLIDDITDVEILLALVWNNI